MKLGPKLTRALGAIVTWPPLVGALVVVALAAWAGQRGAGDDADLGDLRRADAVESFVEHRFASEIARMKLGIVAAALALGLALGLIADLLIRLRYRAPGRPARRGVARAFVESALVCLALQSALVLWAMADSPQLYAARWYAKGGLARTVQVVATDVLGPTGVVLLTLVLCLVYARPAQLVALGRRALARLARPARALSKRTAALLSLVLLAFGALALAHASSSAPAFASAPASALASASASGPPNILILAADSLRADHLDPSRAPNLSRLASRAARFDRAYVSIPRTFPSWVTILTGRHAHHHGIRSMFPTWEERARDFDALPQRLAAAGYATGVVSDYAGDIFSRIDLGFERVDVPSFDFRQLVRQRVLERETPLLPVLHSQLGRRLFPVMRELNDAADPRLLADDVGAALHAFRAGSSTGASGATGASGRRPFFLTVFFSTAHFPYAAPAPYYAKYTDPDYRGRFKYHKPVGLGVEEAPDDADVTQIRALYDGAVTAVDDAAAQVLRALEREGLADNTIVVVTADHGETLHDQGYASGHGDHLFGDEGTHVPLVIYDPRVAKGVRVDGIARDVDLAPTLYELAGVAPPPDLDGLSLAPALGGGALAPRFAYAETELWFTEETPGLSPDLRMPYPGIMALTELDARHNAEIVLRRDMSALTRMARHRMVRDERWKLVYVPTRKGVRYMLFDTLRDPRETVDLAAAKPEEVTRLRAELWRWMLRDPLMEQRDGFLVPRLPGSPARAP